jgi:hypothetical protein
MRQVTDRRNGHRVIHSRAPRPGASRACQRRKLAASGNHRDRLPGRREQGRLVGMSAVGSARAPVDLKVAFAADSLLINVRRIPWMIL